VVRGASVDWATVLTSALDEVGYGIVLLDKDLRARFINRAFHRMWALPPAPRGTTYDFTDLMEHGRRTGAYEVAPEAMADYVRKRIALVRSGSQPPVQLRLSDGRILKFECIAVPDGGRMLTYADISELVHTADQLRELATIDDLTKLLNRRQFLASFEDEFSRALRHDRPLSVVMIDADNFKLINDRHGHSVGDEVLRAIAERCRGILRQGDILGRLGGEEFAAALTETDMPGALRTAERLCKEVAAEPFGVGDEKLKVTVSVGLAVRRAQDTDPGDLLRLADRALYAAKAQGRNRVAADIERR
jgi:diguanylate cyclase (GGDEF)-like protein